MPSRHRARDVPLTASLLPAGNQTASGLGDRRQCRPEIGLRGLHLLEERRLLVESEHPGIEDVVQVALQERAGGRHRFGRGGDA
jgi:hypothetical protein